MKDKLLCMAIWLILCTHMSAQGWSSIQEHGVLPTNTAVENTKRLSSKKVWEINLKLYLCIYGNNDVRTISSNSTSE